jgi:hypothetical protein
VKTFAIYDQSNVSHTLVIEEQALLDGTPTTIVALEKNQVVFSSAPGMIAFSYTALGLAVLGDRPTPDDVGQLLAQSLGRWSAIQALVASLKSLQSCVGQMMTEAQPWLQVSFPEYHFDDLTRRALEAFDGTEETTMMLARILGQSSETIIAWARQIGKAPVETHDDAPASTDEQPDQVAASYRRDENRAAQAVVEKTTRTRFRWTPELEEQLKEDFLTSPITGVVACMREIAEKRGWSYTSVQFKVYELELPQQKKSAATQRETETAAPEDHPSSAQETTNEVHHNEASV